MAILTDANGKPFEKPEAPAKDAPIEEKIAWLRAMATYNNNVTNAANRAFAEQFNKSLRRRK